MMQKKYSVFTAVAAAVLLLCNTVLRAQVDLSNIIDQYTFFQYGYNDIVVSDSITGMSCYDLDFAVHPIGGIVGNPNLGNNEYLDYRENMTVALKLHYAGLQNFMGHPDDRIWLYDPIGRMVETKTIQDNPLIPDEQIFYLNVRGDFEDYKVDMVYYSGELNRYYSFDDVLKYEVNKIVGNTIEPYEYNMAPILFEFISDTIRTTILDMDYDGGICLDIFVNDCANSTIIDMDQICYNMGCENSIIMTPATLTPTVCLEEEAHLRVNGVTSMGTGTLDYQWQQWLNNNWENLVSESTPIYSFTPILADDGNQYRMVMTNEYNCQDTSAVLILKINELPQIDTDPISQHICTSDGVSFNVLASSMVAGLSYQWQEVSTGTPINIIGANNSTYGFLPTLNDNGSSYQVVVSDANGCTATSTPAVLNVSEGLSITIDPQSATVCAGGTASFEVAANSSSGGEIQYQWQQVENGATVDIDGAISATYSFDVNASMDGTSYQVLIFADGASCSITSNEVVLMVAEAEGISSQPQDIVTCDNEIAMFEVVVGGSNLSYQWEQVIAGVATPINGAENSVYSFEPSLTDNNTNYQVVITNGSDCSVTSDLANLQVNESPLITADVLDVDVCNAGTASFEVLIDGNNLTYQWQSVSNGVGTDIFGATNPIYSFQTVATDNGNQYRAVVTNDSGCRIESNIGILTLVDSPIITEQPASLAVCVGYEAVLGVEVAGTNSYDYQWERICYDSGITNWDQSNSTGLINDIFIGVYESGGILYGITYGNVLHVSTDNGLNFNQRSTTDGLGSSNAKAVYEINGIVYVATSGGLSYSSDGGMTFQNLSTINGLGSNDVLDVYGRGAILCAATTNGLSISTDGGQSFVNTTTSNGLGDNLIYGVYILNSGLYAATESGLSISTDGGQSFVNRTTADGLGADRIAGVYVSDTGVIYAATSNGVSYSTDGGLTFVNQTTANGLGSNICYNIHGAGNTVVVATANGLGLSMDGGQQFQNLTIANGLGSNSIWDVFMSGNHIYAGTSQDITLLGSTTTIQNATSAVYSFVPDSESNICNYQVVISNGSACSVISYGVQVTLEEDCDYECADNYTGVNQLVGNQVITEDYETSSSISSNQIIKFNAKVDYDATIEIDLLPGFEVKIGSEFDAFIDGCNNGEGGNQ